MRKSPHRHLAVAVGCAALVSTSLVLTSCRGSAGKLNETKQALSGNCGLANPALCETFRTPAPSGTRSGAMNGLLWGVSRMTGSNNGAGVFDPWAPAAQQYCGSNTVMAENDMTLCNLGLVETVNDNEGATIWAAYPKQPFDIAGRTGTVTFDVNSDSQGSHMAWPTFMYTDQPVPAPNGDPMSPIPQDTPRNAVGFSLDRICSPSVPCFFPDGHESQGMCNGVDNVFTTTNYQSAYVELSIDDCVQVPTSTQTAAGMLNHFEVDISPTSITIWGTDPGQSTMKRLAHANNINVPLTRGLIWIEDQHYNACKAPGTQCNHSFVWANVGFDGPVLPRDLTFDVLDALDQNQYGVDNLGYILPGDGSFATMHTIATMTSANISAASGALLLFNDFPYDQQTITYSLNGHTSHTIPWRAGSPTFTGQTVAVPVALSELQPGSNAISLRTDDGAGLSVSNLDIVLLGAAGIVPPGATPDAGTPPPPPPPDSGTPDSGTPQPTNTTLTFDNTGQTVNQAFSGEYPSGVIDWGTGQWYLSGPFAQLATDSITFSGDQVNSAQLSFVGSGHLVQLDADNSSLRATRLQISCAGQTTVSQDLAARAVTTVQTGWSQSCSPVTVQTENGWNTSFDNVVIAP